MPQLSKSQIFLWDITIPANDLDYSEVQKVFKEHCKQWVFQKEKGATTDYEHYQCRVNLKKKTRNPTDIIKGHWSPTQTKVGGSFEYAMKDDTRIAGPWKDTDLPLFIPSHLRDPVLRESQQQAYQQLIIQDKRRILFWKDEPGNAGKSFLSQYLQCYKKAIYIPPICTTPQQMAGFYYASATRTYKESKIIIIDIPRSAAFNQKAFADMMTVIETIKDGYAMDGRNNAKFILTEIPKVIVFYNSLPKDTKLTDYLSVTKIDEIKL